MCPVKFGLWPVQLLLDLAYWTLATCHWPLATGHWTLARLIVISAAGHLTKFGMCPVKCHVASVIVIGPSERNEADNSMPQWIYFNTSIFWRNRKGTF